MSHPVSTRRAYLLLALCLVPGLVLAGCAPPPPPTDAVTTQPAKVPAPTAMPAPTNVPAPTAVPAPSTAAPATTKAPAMSPSGSTIVDLLKAFGDFTAWVCVLSEDGYIGTLQTKGPFTVFAPTDQAFRNYLSLQLGVDVGASSSGEELCKITINHISSKDALDSLVKQHIVGAEIRGLHLRELTTTLAGQQVALMRLAKVDNAHILGSEFVASNGIIYPIDGLLAPVVFVEPKLPSGLGGFEEWLPYQVGQPLRIGDAELVPGHPIMREAVRLLGEKEVLKGTKINTARTVRLEGDGEAVYLAPVALNVRFADTSFFNDAARAQGVIIGTLVVFSPTQQVYAQRVRLKDSRWFLDYVTPDGKIAATMEVGVPELPKDDDDVPVAGICYGTKWCCVHWLGGAWCFPCLFGPYSSKVQCVSACQ